MSDNGWISVDERLPDERVRVLMYDADNPGEEEEVGTYRQPRNEYETGWLNDYGDICWNVTHWQPLPPSPEATP